MPNTGPGFLRRAMSQQPPKRAPDDTRCTHCGAKVSAHKPGGMEWCASAAEKMDGMRRGKRRRM